MYICGLSRISLEPPLQRIRGGEVVFLRTASENVPAGYGQEGPGTAWTQGRRRGGARKASRRHRQRAGPGQVGIPMKICVASCPSLLLRPGEVRRRFVALHVELLKNERREFCGWRRRVLGGRGPVPPLDAPLHALPARRPAGTSDRPLPRTTSRRIPGRCSPPALRRRIRAKPRSSAAYCGGGGRRGRTGPRMLALTPAGRAVWSPWKPALSPCDALAGYPDQQVLRDSAR